jgi:hypothetical protein
MKEEKRRKTRKVKVRMMKRKQKVLKKKAAVKVPRQVVPKVKAVKRVKVILKLDLLKN